MTKQYVAKVSELVDGDRKMITVGDKEIGVFYQNGNYYAYENKCIHQGGPVCEGKIVRKVEAVLNEDKEWIEEKYSDNILHVVCPWHGFEFDLATGECAGRKDLKLNQFEVQVKGDELYVLI